LIATSSAIPIGSGVREIETWSPMSADLAFEFEYIDIAAIDREQKAITATARTRACDAPSRARQIVQKGDVLVSTVRPALNAVAVVPPSLDGAIASTGFTVLRSDERRLHGPYLFHWVRGTAFIDEMVRLATGASHPAASDRVVKGSSIPIPFPDDPRRSLAEQKRIAAIVDKADAIRRRRQEAARLADTLIPSVFYEMFGDPVLNRKGWPTRPLGEMIDFMTSGSRGWAAFYANSGRMFLRIQNVGRNRLLLDDVQYVQVEDSAESRRTATQPADVLVTVTADLGRTAVIPEGFGPAHINQHIVLLRSTQIEPLFLSQFLASPAGQRQFTAKNRAAVKAGLNFDDIKSVKVVLPPRPLQTQFADAYRRIERFTADLVSRETASDTLFKSLVQRAFRGQL
jgi:type I restriction enzyme, S subunit